MNSSFPKSIIVVGAGAFGLSTALAVAKKYAETKVTVIDRHTPPVPDGTSVDHSRILRPDYIDRDYETLAEKAQDIIKNDCQLQPYYFENGFTFCVDGQPGEFDTLWRQMLNHAKDTQPSERWQELSTSQDVFQNLHGTHGPAQPTASELGRPRRWNQGFVSKRCATVNAAAMINVYYERCLTFPNIKFVLGTPVNRLLYDRSKQRCEGVILENGSQITAETVVIATGAWTGRLVDIRPVMTAHAVGIGYIRLTPTEYAHYKNMGCHTNLVTGTNIFTPINGLLKILRRSSGVINTTELPHPDDASRTYRISHPLTKLDDPKQTLTPEMEANMRDDMREIIPQFAERPFEQTRLCWLEQTTNGDFLICPHPRVQNLHLATGGSLHGWKFLPLLGEFVVASLDHTLDKNLVRKWSWESKLDASLGKFGFMVKGAYRELRAADRARL